ncbi:hypothetical protein PFTANZ_06043, partial [Plasmodium falciparum Tanzania (2000708)]
ERPAPAGVKERPAQQRPPPKPKAPTREGLGRSLGRRSKEDEEEEVVEDHSNDQGEDNTEKEESGPTATTTQDGVKPACEIVETLFESTKNFEDACKQKYGGNNSRLGWKCVNNTSVTAGGVGGKREGKGGSEGGASGKDTGGICIPPRRRKLYLHKMEGDEVKDATALRTWFVKSAAVETFFAWHKFKMDKKKEEKEKNEIKGIYTLPGQDDTSIEENLQKQLKNGTIPDDFKRQMFYTFGDYKDILFGKDMGKDMEKMKKNIDKVFENNEPKNGKKRENWWDDNAKHIWEGMICALSYNTDTKEMNNQLREKLKEVDNKNTYDEVTFKGGLNGDTKLDEFSRMPQFFRWLEEWGEEFCRKRTHKLAQIKHECRRDN